ncbi:methionyl-tRNA formyltransferase [Paenibacillus elgii]|uniref:Methionyl-tRNA formyltransferase n=1 Tax=Paenibacillus elgii TaxID=189691 RepID=A0A2T6G9H9_9BACL|nr:methionyl-tRNA formyltransferase [Paenibacillus elgii]
MQTEAECTYNILVHNGRKYIQINTYGSKERVHTNVVSQSIQLDEQSAKQLIDIIKTEYLL